MSEYDTVMGRQRIIKRVRRKVERKKKNGTLNKDVTKVRPLEYEPTLEQIEIEKKKIREENFKLGHSMGGTRIRYDGTVEDFKADFLGKKVYKTPKFGNY